MGVFDSVMRSVNNLRTRANKISYLQYMIDSNHDNAKLKDQLQEQLDVLQGADEKSTSSSSSSSRSSRSSASSASSESSSS